MYDSVQSNIGNEIDSSRQNIQNLGSELGSLEQAGAIDFAGMDFDKVGDFKQALESYRTSVQNIINGFNDEAALEGAVKGPVASSVHSYLVKMKELLNNYVQILDRENGLVNDAVLNYQRNAMTISSKVNAETDTVVSASAAINLD